MSNQYTDDQIKEARARLWYMGNLQWKLDPTQKRMYDLWKKMEGRVSVLNISRRVGKSYFLTILGIEQCLIKPGSKVKFLQPEQKMIRLNIRPIMDSILIDCPPNLRPEFKTQDNIYRFPNGSEIQLAGTDGGYAEKLRGGDSDLCLIDEAAFVKSELQYLVRSILMPTTLLTRGKIVLSSTSPTTKTHDFATYMEQAATQGNLIKITIFDALKDNEGLTNPRLTKELIDDIIKEYPNGINNDEFRREYLCVIIQNGDNAVVPEFEEVEEDTVCSWFRPTFCDKYAAMDIGFKDLTVVLFGYWDFENAVLIVEDEIVMSGPQMTTDKLALNIQEKEKELWTNKLTLETEKPYKRVSDNNLIVLNDLNRLHGLTFMPTSKDNKEMAINNMRMMIRNRQIIINPRCKTLITHLKYGTWNKNRDDFLRSADNGHYDAIDALIYLVRNIDRSKNPFPRGYSYRHLNPGDDKFLNPYNENRDPKHESFKKMFKINK